MYFLVEAQGGSRSLRGERAKPLEVESVMSESPSVGGPEKESIARAQEGFNSMGSIIDI